MSEETVSSDGQDQARGVTRRRFIQATAIGGGATVMASSCTTLGNASDSTRICRLIGDFKGHDSCKRTLNFICDHPIGTLFTDPFHEVIFRAKGNVEPSDWALVSALHTELVNQDTCTLLSLFLDDQGTWPGRVADECDAVRAHFAFPFFGLSPEQRSAIAEFLSPKEDEQDFFEAFGTQSLGEVYTTLVRDMHLWEIHLIQKAKRLGILKFHHTVAEENISKWPHPLDKGKCAYYTGTMWKCTGGKDDDVCGTVPPTGGELEAGSDICP